MILYKVLNKNDLQHFNNNEFFYGTNKDKIDGFIHLSKWTQIRNTVKKHFKKDSKIFLLKIYFKNTKNIKFEKSRDNMFFPHLYGNLNKNCVIEVFDYKKIEKIFDQK
tara:strand:+ start:611 stop:934 length:324 start_codon:yes stop_codon:yes gene_type:complete